MATCKNLRDVQVIWLQKQCSLHSSADGMSIASTYTSVPVDKLSANVDLAEWTVRWSYGILSKGADKRWQFSFISYTIKPVLPVASSVMPPAPLPIIPALRDPWHCLCCAAAVASCSTLCQKVIPTHCQKTMSELEHNPKPCLTLSILDPLSRTALDTTSLHVSEQAKLF